MDTRLTCRAARPLIWERAAGDLAPEERGVIEAHLAQCAGCREESRRAARAFELLAVVDQPVAPRPDGWERLYRRITAPVVPLWRRVTAPALTSATATAAILALAIGRIATVSPGPGEVVVRAHDSQPKPQPKVQVFGKDGSLVASNALGGNLTVGWIPVAAEAPGEKPGAPPSGTAVAAQPGKARPGKKATVVADGRTRRYHGPIVLTAKPVMLPPGAVSGARPPERTAKATEEPVVRYTVDTSGDIFGRTIRSTDADI